MSNPFAHKSADELAAMWQLKAMAWTFKNSPKLFAILLRVLANEYTAVTHNTWAVILRGMTGTPDLPGNIVLQGYARVEPSGRVTTIATTRDGEVFRMALYRNKYAFVSDMRRIADKLKLNDGDRIAMFDVLKGWITEDKTVSVHGEKIAS